MNEQIVDDALADAALNPHMLSQVTFGTEMPCGSVYCLAGFIAARAGAVFRDGKWWINGMESSAYSIAVIAADMTYEQSHEMFLASGTDDLKELNSRWNRLTGREL